MYEETQSEEKVPLSLEETQGWKRIHLSYKTDTDSVVRTQKIKEAAAAFMNVLMEIEVSENNRPNGRLLALSKTSLEESCMWAIKSIHAD